MKLKSARETEERAVARFSDLVEPDDAGTDSADKDANSDWSTQLKVDKKTGEIEPSIQNACVLLRNLPDFKGKLGYNPMSDVVTVKGELPWWKTQKYDRLEDMFKEELENMTEDEQKKLPPKLTQEGEDPWTENDWDNFYA